MHVMKAYAIQNQILSSQFRGVITGQVGSRRSISALPDQISISSSLTNLVLLTNLKPRNSDKKIERVEAVEESDEEAEENREVREVGLAERAVRHRLAPDAVELERLVEAHIGC